MWIYDQETLAFLEVNHAAVIRYGYSRQEFLRMIILDIRPTEDIPGVIRSTLHPKEKSTVTCALYRHRDKSGQIFKVEITSREIVFQGRPAMVVLALNPVAGDDIHISATSEGAIPPGTN
jgi:PAS domain S-box-containing protein